MYRRVALKINSKKTNLYLYSKRREVIQNKKKELTQPFDTPGSLRSLGTQGERRRDHPLSPRKHLMIFQICLGTFIGLIYSVSFIAQQWTILHANSLMRGILLFCVRVILLLAVVYYLLHSPTRDSILVLASFIMTFWVILLLKKARLHGGF